MQITDLTAADEFVAEQQDKGNTVWWDGWKMCFFRKSPHAMYRGGVRHNNQYGYLTVVDVDTAGTWNVPARLVL